MEPNPGIEAVQKLASMGYRFKVARETINGLHEGEGTPDPTQVRPLLAMVKEHKAEVLDYLTQTPRAPERELTCADCAHFSAYPGPNPKQAYGRCLKRNRGRYGCATPCDAALTDSVVGV